MTNKLASAVLTQHCKLAVRQPQYMRLSGGNCGGNCDVGYCGYVCGMSDVNDTSHICDICNGRQK
jgi:hypothetical protein